MNPSALPLVALLAALCGIAACDELDHAREEPLDDATLDAPADTADASALDCGTLYEHTCPAEQWCYGAPTCGAAWSCQSEYPGCSAAPPFRVCGCDGVIGDAAAGCPERHAWSLEAFAGLSGAETGQPCDASAAEPLVFALELAGTGYTGVSSLRLRLRRASGVEPDALTFHEDEDGTVSARFAEVSQAVGGSFFVDVFGDVDGDGACVDGVDIVGIAVPERVDLIGMVLYYPLEPESLLPLMCADLEP